MTLFRIQINRAYSGYELVKILFFLISFTINILILKNLFKNIINTENNIIYLIIRRAIISHFKLKGFTLPAFYILLEDICI